MSEIIEMKFPPEVVIEKIRAKIAALEKEIPLAEKLDAQREQSRREIADKKKVRQLMAQEWERANYGRWFAGKNPYAEEPSDLSWADPEIYFPATSSKSRIMLELLTLQANLLGALTAKEIVLNAAAIMNLFPEEKK